MSPDAVLIIAYRDLLKFLRDPPRILGSLVFPLIFVGVMGSSLQANLGGAVGYDFMAFTFTGILAETLFQSTAFGIIFLMEDRQNDFSQEIFVSPISRYAIVLGKIVGETLVSLAQGLAIVLFAVVIGVPMTVPQALLLLPVSIAVCLLGGAFGVLVLSNITSQQAANQIFPFIMLPQYFLAGVFSPIQVLPPYLEILSRISPLRYAVDLTRNTFYAGHPDYPLVILDGPALNLVVAAVLFFVFLVIGTFLFVRSERNR